MSNGAYTRADRKLCWDGTSFLWVNGKKWMVSPTQEINVHHIRLPAVSSQAEGILPKIFGNQNYLKRFQSACLSFCPILHWIVQHFSYFFHLLIIWRPKNSIQLFSLLLRLYFMGCCHRLVHVFVEHQKGTISNPHHNIHGLSIFWTMKLEKENHYFDGCLLSLSC